MLLWPLLVIAVIAFVIFGLDGSFPDALRGEGSTARLIYLCLILAGLVVLGGRLRRIAIAPALKMIGAWLGIFLLVIAAYSFRDEAKGLFDRIRGEISPTTAITNANGEVELRKGQGGHFSARAEVNGTTVPMLIDTGASLVVLSYEDAEAIGLTAQNLAFTRPVTTANGRAFVAYVTLDNVTIGSVSLSNVRGAVAAEGALRTSLLGMSFLGELSETSFRGDRLFLKN